MAIRICDACEYFPAKYVAEDQSGYFCHEECAQLYYLGDKQHWEDIDKGLTRAKARYMAHEKTIRGHKITPRQRRYFYWVAGGKKRRKKGKK